MKDKPNLLFICSVNRMRSATAEKIFASDPRFHVASAGTEKNAEVHIDQELLEWADWVLVMEPSHERKIRQLFPKIFNEKKVVSLSVPDVFHFMEPALIELLREKVERFYTAKIGER